jgi:Copper chaperone
VSEIEAVRFPVAGMTCTSCVNRITRSLRKMDGVSSVRVDLRHETATIVRDPGRVSDASLAAAVAGAGYEADLAASVIVAAAGSRGFLERLLERSRRARSDHE